MENLMYRSKNYASVSGSAAFAARRALAFSRCCSQPPPAPNN
jgi:hypothetical protein